MKVAILHEMLIKLGGAEKVVESMMRIFPEADLYTLLYDEEKTGKTFPHHKIHPQVHNLKSQKVYKLLKKQRFCLPVMAASVEELDLSNYDLVLCSSSGFAHGAITKPETKFVVYYHAPARYMWDWTHQYQEDLGINSGIKSITLGPIIRHILHKNRIWDYTASNRVDVNLANSINTQNRIKKYYRKESKVLYPPVETKRFAVAPLNEIYNKPFENYYIIISALTEFKKIDVAIEGFNNLEENLVVIGAGDYKPELEAKVLKNNIQFVGPKYADELVFLVQNSLGLIFPGEEDFGIVPIEVMAAGKPVFAYNGGGLTETVIAGKTGEFFDDKDGEDFVEKFEKFHKKNLKGFYNPLDCQTQADNFSEDRFKEKLLSYIN